MGTAGGVGPKRGTRWATQLFHNVELRVQTNGQKTPTQALNDAMNALIYEVQVSTALAQPDVSFSSLRAPR